MFVILGRKLPLDSHEDETHKHDEDPAGIQSREAVSAEA